VDGLVLQCQALTIVDQPLDIYFTNTEFVGQVYQVWQVTEVFLQGSEPQRQLGTAASLGDSAGEDFDIGLDPIECINTPDPGIELPVSGVGRDPELVQANLDEACLAAV
jgi:hypothetical protein